MGVIGTFPIPLPEVEHDEHLSGIRNVDNSEMGGEHSSVNNYSVDLNFVSLHLNTLASAGSLVFVILIGLLFARFLLTGGTTRMFESIMSLRCLLPCLCCRRDRAPDLGLQEPSAPSIQQDISRQDGALQQGGPAWGSLQDQQGPHGASLVELQELHSSLMHELKSLKKAARSNRRLETVSQGMIRGLREEMAGMQRAQHVQQSDTRSEPQ